MESGSIKRRYLYFAIIIFLIAGGYLFYCMKSAQTYENAYRAYQDRDWATAKNDFLSMQTTFQYSLPDRQNNVKNYLSIIDSLEGLQKTKAKNNYLKSMETYNAVKAKFPETYAALDLDTEKIQYLVDTMELLHKEKRFEEAIEVYRYMDSKAYLYDIDDIDESNLAELYYDWAIDLQENENYKESAKKLELVRIWYNKYYDPEKINEELQKTHFLLANKWIEQEDYELAEAELVYIIDRWPESPTAIQAKNLYPYTALHYATILHENHDFKIEVELLENTKEEYPESDQIGAVNDSLMLAYEALADQLMNFGEYYTSCDYYETILENSFNQEVIDRVSEKNEKSKAALLTNDDEEGQKILTRIRDEFCSGDFDFPGIIEDVPTSANKALVCSGIEYTLPLSQTAQSLAELRYVINMDLDQQEVETCTYENDYYLERQQNHINIDVYDVTTQRLAKTTDLFGVPPMRCPETFKFNNQYVTLVGDEIEETDIENWLNQFLP